MNLHSFIIIIIIIFVYYLDTSALRKGYFLALLCKQLIVLVCVPSGFLSGSLNFLACLVLATMSSLVFYINIGFTCHCSKLMKKLQSYF